MKKITMMMGLLMAFGFSAMGQSLQPGPAGYDVSFTPEMFQRQRAEVQATRTVSCSVDTVQYALAKATGLSLLSVNNATSADQVGQWFDATPDNPVTIHGFSFYAFANAALGAGSLDVVCSVFPAGADSLPVPGPALATTTIQVDTNFFGGSFAALSKFADFASPITVTAPYVLVVSNAVATSLAMVNNSWTAGNGQQEWLGMASIAGNWVHGYDLNIGGNPFDADVLLEPFVTFDFSTSFESDQACIIADVPATFTNTSDAFITSRFYNLFTFDAHFGFAPLDSSFAWNYGDFSPIGYGVDGSHVYSGTQQSHDVVLYAGTLGYSRLCVDSATVTVPVGAEVTGGFSFDILGNQAVDFTDASTGADSIAWDFGDGTTSAALNPSHTYATGGTYTVSHIAYGCAGNDTTVQEVVVFTTGLAQGLEGSLSVFPNPTTGAVNVELSLDRAAEVQVSVLNLLGQEVRNLVAGRVANARLALDLSGLEAGVYLVRVQAGDRQETLRVRLQ